MLGFFTPALEGLDPAGLSGHTHTYHHKKTHTRIYARTRPTSQGDPEGELGCALVIKANYYIWSGSAPRSSAWQYFSLTLGGRRAVIRGFKQQDELK